MKKILFCFILIGSLILGVVPCMAANEGNVLVGSAESDEILTDIDVILKDVESYDITQDSLILENTIKVYTNINVLKQEIKNADEMREFLKEADYVYGLPAYTDSAAYYLTIAMGDEISEEMLDKANISEEGRIYLASLVGKWNVTEVRADEHSENPRIDDYYVKINNFLNCYGLENSEVFFVGGITSKSIVTAICFTDGHEPYYVAVDNIDMDAKSIEEIEDTVYTYDEIKEFSIKDDNYTKIESETMPESEYIGNYGAGLYDIFMHIVLPVIIAAAVVVVIVILVRKHRRKAA